MWASLSKRKDRDAVRQRFQQARDRPVRIARFPTNRREPSPDLVMMYDKLSACRPQVLRSSPTTSQLVSHKALTLPRQPERLSYTSAARTLHYLDGPCGR